MASPQNIVFGIYNAAGTPLTGAAGSMTWAACCDETGAAITPPTITEVGGGLYSFIPSWSTGHGFAYVIAMPAGASPPYIGGYVRPEDYGGVFASPSPQIIVFPVWSSSGGLKVGASCSFTKYSDETGAAITAPTISAVGSTGLYKFAPNFTPNHDACYVINFGSGSSPSYASGFIRAEDFAYEAPPTLPVVAPTIAPATTSYILGTDTYCLTDLLTVSVPVSGLQMVGQRIIHRLMTPRGALAIIGGDPSFGFDVRQLVLAKLGPNEVALAQSQIEAEVEKDEEVAEAQAQLVLNRATGALTINLSVTTADGPFTLVLGVDELTVQQLDFVAA